MAYLSWDGSPWCARIVGDTFLHAPNGDWTKAHEDTIINYTSWDGSLWQATVSNGIFRHAPGGDMAKSHTDSILGYLATDRSQWTVKIGSAAASEPPITAASPQYATIGSCIGGGHGGWGTKFSLFAHGETLSKFEAWADGDRVNAIRVTLTNGVTASYGRPPNQPDEFKCYTFSPGEYFTSMTMWGNGDGWEDGGPGRIQFETNKGSFDIGADSGNGTMFSVPIDQNIPVGVAGMASSEYLNFVGFIVLKRVVSASLTDVVYPLLDASKVGLSPSDLNTVTYTNTGSSDQTYTFSGSKTVTRGGSWNVKMSLSVSLGYKVTAGVPEIAEVEQQVQVTISAETTHEANWSDSETRSWEFPVVVPKRTRTKAGMTLRSATLNIPFTGKLRLMVIGVPDEITMDVEGTYEGVDYVDAELYTEETSLDGDAGSAVP